MKLRFYFAIAAVAIIAVVGVLSCVKQDDDMFICMPREPRVEATIIQHFCDSINLQQTKTIDSSGIVYQIVSMGSGKAIADTSSFDCQYKGTLLNGKIFDSTATGKWASINLNRTIQGWKKTLPKINKGGHIKMVLPSAWAYDCFPPPTSIIPPNAPLYFDIIVYDK